MFSLIPDHILKEETFNAHEKILVGMAHGFALDGGCLTLSNEKLSIYLSCSVRQVQRALAKLETQNVIERVIVDENRKVYLKDSWLVRPSNEVTEVRPPTTPRHTPTTPCHTEYNSNININKKKKQSTSNEAQHTHIDDQINGSKKAPKLNMKEQLKGARLVTDEKGRQGLVLPNGSKQIKSYPNIFLLPTQYTELQQTYEKEFSELNPQKYLKWSLNRLNEWIDQNPAKANRYMGHFKVLNDGWVLSAAKVEYNIDLRNNNIKNSMNRGNRD